MRGGFWRSFQINYREINDLHKQMLRVSRKVDALRNGRGGAVGERGARPVAADQLARIADHLYQGQSNDCYWHGLFGGIYLSHMRLATLEHLIAAEDAADRAAGASGVTVEAVDLDIDGYDELLVSAPGQVVAIKPGEGGGIGSWDVRAVRHALASVMRRRPEAYHDTLARRGQRRGRGAGGRRGRRVDPRPHQGQRAGHQQAALVRRLRAALGPASTSCRWGPRRTTFEQADFVELGDFVSGAFEVVEAGGDRVVLERDGSVTGCPRLERPTARERPAAGAQVLQLRGRPTRAHAGPHGGRHQHRRPADRGPAGHRVGAQHAGWRRQSLGLVRGRRGPRPLRRAPGGGRGRPREHGQQLHRHRAGVAPAAGRGAHGGPRSRPSPSRRAASRATTRVAACCGSGRCAWSRARRRGSSLANLVRTFADRAEEEGL